MCHHDLGGSLLLCVSEIVITTPRLYDYASLWLCTILIMHQCNFAASLWLCVTVTVIMTLCHCEYVSMCFCDSVLVWLCTAGNLCHCDCVIVTPCMFRGRPQGSGVVRHYHIKKNSKKLYYLSDNHAFDNIPDLIFYHKHNSAGQCLPSSSAKYFTELRTTYRYTYLTCQG